MEIQPTVAQYVATVLAFHVSHSTLVWSHGPVLSIPLVGVKQNATNPDIVVKRRLNNTHATRVGFEPMHTKHIELAVHHLNL